mmetsp:Transcript_23348/g.26873  ORF Transcript_23348/g.26873 Transcript_23348/m.26873 type:complete len:169 (-) Transcript_23348:488-994(-)
MITDAAAVGIGAVFGALTRYQIGKTAGAKIASDPQKYSHLSGWHTTGINIIGSFALGVVGGAEASSQSSTTATNAPNTPKSPTNTAQVPSVWKRHLQNTLTISPRGKLMLGVGFCGSFTTFSTYSLDVVAMIGRNELLKACSYVAANNCGGIMAAAAGFAMVRKIRAF